ncbi:MAG: sigma-54 interaction domain-containing protein [Bacillota bacterium]|nr:sigma 54-interacting transcriptional regulator [Candidatus Fermentithermobacillaceae bacterium]
MDISSSLSVILEGISQGVHVVDRDGVTVIYNKAASEIDGLSDREVIGKDVLSVFPSLDRHTSTLLRVLRTGIPEVDRQQTFTNYKGKKITTINSTYPIMSGGKVIGACEISSDVTGLKEMSERILDLRRELRGRRSPARGARALYTLDDIVGESQVMREVKRTAARVAESDAGVMVWGETGTGKELLVQAIHSASPRAGSPFVPQNCAAMPESLLEGLFFGTSRGGFTGATDRPGLMEIAAGGTLYLDEIDSMPLGLQAKMLRAIQEKKVRRLGDTRERPVDVRFIASTSVSPAQAVKAGLLRSDLYYRLSVVEIGLPRLRDRREDIPLLWDHFLHKHSKGPAAGGSQHIKQLSPQVMAAFLAYEWPGNVRELEHAIEGSLALSRGPVIEIEDLPPAVRGIGHTASVYMEAALAGHGKSPAQMTGRQLVEPGSASAPVARGLHPSGHPRDDETGMSASLPLKHRLRLEERAAVEEALKAAGTVAKAARLLGIPRQTLQYRMKVLGIAAPSAHAQK